MEQCNAKWQGHNLLSSFSSLKPFSDNQSQKELPLYQQLTMTQDSSETYYKVAVLLQESYNIS